MAAASISPSNETNDNETDLNKDNDNDNQNNCCPICLDIFEDDKSRMVVTPALCGKNHIIHSYCLFEWMLKKLECPLCKKSSV